MAKKKDSYDWEAIEKDVRAGVLSIREVSRRFKCPESSIRAKMKEFGWERSLVDRVRERAQEKVLRNGLRKSNATDEEIIEEKSEEVARVLLSHRRDIVKMKQAEQNILAELEDNPTKLWIGQYQGKIIQKEIGIAVTERAAALNNLANVQHKRIALERQAFGINDGVTPDDDNLKEIILRGIAANHQEG